MESIRERLKALQAVADMKAIKARLLSLENDAQVHSFGHQVTAIEPVTVLIAKLTAQMSLVILSLFLCPLNPIPTPFWSSLRFLLFSGAHNCHVAPSTGQ